MKYIYPPRAVNAVPPMEHGFLGEGWIAQYKFNDSHALLQYLGPNEYVIWDRHGKRLQFHPSSELDEQLKRLYQDFELRGECWLDGGVLDSRHPSVKDVVVIWDLLAEDGKQLLDVPYRDRYDRLFGFVSSAVEFEMLGESVGLQYGSKVLLPRCFGRDDWAGMWDVVHRVNERCPLNARGEQSPLLEGLMFKLSDHRLKPAFGQKNNVDFMIRSRVATRRHAF